MSVLKFFFDVIVSDQRSRIVCFTGREYVDEDR